MNHFKKKTTDVDGLKEGHKELIKNIKLILKTQERSRIEKHNIYTEEINEIALSSNDDKTIQSIDSIETYAHGTSKDLVYKKEEIKCSNIIKKYKNIWLWLYYKRRHKRT